MPSAIHQWLLVWIARRMTRDGFVVSGFDGLAPRGLEWTGLPTPFAFRGVRADAWGQRTAGRLIAFGEAKTVNDVDTDHTRQQFEIIGKTRMKGVGTPCPLYVGVPRSAVYDLDRVLIDVGLLGAKHVIRLHVPDVLLEDAQHGSREDYRTPA